jgi:hypothetical protein
MGVKHLLARGWQAATKSLKQFAGFVAPPYGGARNYWLPGSRVNYHAQVGDGTGSSTVTAPLFWIDADVPGGAAALWHKLDDGQEEQVLDHELLRLLERPNEYYTGVILWMATVIDWMVDGNAYWLKLRDKTGRRARAVVGAALDDRAAAATTRSFIATTSTRRTGDVPPLDPDDVVHFRFGSTPTTR